MADEHQSIASDTKETTCMPPNAPQALAHYSMKALQY
jgi:hypothetical protein